LGREPLAVGVVEGRLHIEGELRREVFLLRPAVVQVLDQLFLHGGQPLAVLVQLLEQRHVFFRVRQPVQLLAEHRHVVAGGRHALLRRAALHVEAKLADRPLIDVYLVQNAVQLFDSLFIRHCIFHLFCRDGLIIFLPAPADKPGASGEPELRVHAERQKSAASEQERPDGLCSGQQRLLLLFSIAEERHAQQFSVFIEHGKAEVSLVFLCHVLQILRGDGHLALLLPD